MSKREKYNEYMRKYMRQRRLKGKALLLHCKHCGAVLERLTGKTGKDGSDDDKTNLEANL